MSDPLVVKAQQVVQTASKLGAQGVRALVHRSKKCELAWRDGRQEQLFQATQMGLQVTLYVDGRYSYHTTNDLRPEAVERFLAESVAMTRLLAKDPHRKLPDPDRYRMRFGGDLQQDDQKGSDAVTNGDRLEAVQGLEAAARSVDGAERIVSVKTYWTDSRSTSASVTSNGMRGSDRSTSFDLDVEVNVRDQGGRKPEGYWGVIRRFRSGLPSVEEVGKVATRRALAAIGAKPVKSGTYACVVENGFATNLIQGLIDPLHGSAIQQKSSFLADKQGQLITSPIFSMTDDPHLPGGLGSCSYDSEGMSTRKMPVFDQGVLKSFYLDTYYGSLLGREPTTDASTNLVFSTGDKDLEGLIQTMGNGILINEFIGGNLNATTGDFSFGIRGFLIENGARTRPVAEMNVAGNFLDFWKRIAEMGNDPDPNSSWRTPSLLFDRVQFAGL